MKQVTREEYKQRLLELADGDPVRAEPITPSDELLDEMEAEGYTFGFTDNGAPQILSPERP